ncbi:hypothetical protein HYU19_03055 [Candidatus Woesearchaeota archaeon]|nr:hypothetical protein [Candidatus Woesearchaeota archaeon]
MKKFLLAIFILSTALAALFYANEHSLSLLGSQITEENSITGRAIANPVFSHATIIQEPATITPIILFCPREDCVGNLLGLINAADSIQCAFFELNIPGIIGAMKSKNTSLVIDGDNKEEELGNDPTFVRYDTSSQFSHNKFCIFNDKIVVTGSFNPTAGGAVKNNNNIVVLSSAALAKNYREEFEELWDGKFGEGAPVRYPVVMSNGTLIENYFCPEDQCARHTIETIAMANSSIYFMTFSFTHDGIGDAVLDAAKRGVEINGLFEKSQNSTYNEFHRLKREGLDVRWDSNPAAMHHKVFIIDKNIVITGSFNPTKNADTRNDENMIILHDETIAAAFLREFDLLMPSAPSPSAAS